MVTVVTHDVTIHEHDVHDTEAKDRVSNHSAKLLVLEVTLNHLFYTFVEVTTQPNVGHTWSWLVTHGHGWSHLVTLGVTLTLMMCAA